MADMIGNNGLDLAIAADGVAGTLTAAKLHLFQGNPVVDRDTTIATLNATEATYSGYVAQDVTYLLPSISDDGNVEVIAQCPEFRPTGPTITNVVTGAYLTDAAGTALLFVVLFDTGAPMESALDSLIVTLRWRTQTAGLADIIS